MASLAGQIGFFGFALPVGFFGSMTVLFTSIRTTKSILRVSYSMDGNNKVRLDLAFAD